MRLRVIRVRRQLKATAASILAKARQLAQDDRLSLVVDRGDKQRISPLSKNGEAELAPVEMHLDAVLIEDNPDHCRMQ